MSCYHIMSEIMRHFDTVAMFFALPVATVIKLLPLPSVQRSCLETMGEEVVLSYMTLSSLCCPPGCSTQYLTFQLLYQLKKNRLQARCSFFALFSQVTSRKG